MNALKVTAWRQLNKRTLPNLMPGENVFRVTAGRMAPGWLLEVKMAYSIDGKSFEQTRRIGKFPFYFKIDTGDVKENYPKLFDTKFNVGRLQMEAIRLRLVPAAGAMADVSMPTDKAEIAFRKACPHPADMTSPKIQKTVETQLIETNGFFPQEHAVLRDKDKMYALLQKMGTGKTEMAKWQAIEDLGAYPDAFETLLAKIPNANGDVLLHLCKALAERADKRALAPLLARWQEAPGGAPGSRYIPDVLAAIGDRHCVPDLVRPLKGLRFDFRFHIAYALGVLGGPLAEETLQDLAANDPMPAVRTLATEQLQNLRVAASQGAPVRP